MKTAVSIPDPLFKAADRLAKSLGISRSELYARALERLMALESDASITARLDEIYSDEQSRLDPGLARAQTRATAEDW